MVSSRVIMNIHLAFTVAWGNHAVADVTEVIRVSWFQL